MNISGSQQKHFFTPVDSHSTRQWEGAERYAIFFFTWYDSLVEQLNKREGVGGRYRELRCGAGWGWGDNNLTSRLKQGDSGYFLTSQNRWKNLEILRFRNFKLWILILMIFLLPQLLGMKILLDCKGTKLGSLGTIFLFLFLDLETSAIFQYQLRKDRV